MTRSAALISTIVLALSLTSSATPLVTIDKPSQGINLPFAVQLNVANVTIPEIDRARASHLFARGQAKVAGNYTTNFDRRASSFFITNTAIGYSVYDGHQCWKPCNVIQTAYRYGLVKRPGR